MTSHSKIAKNFVLIAVVILIWQHLAEETFASAATPPETKYQIQRKFSIHRQPVPTLLDFASMYFSQGLRHDHLGHWREAIVAFKEAIVIRPDYEVAYLGLGIVYSKIGVWQEALASFGKAVGIDPDYAEGHLGLGIAYTMLGRNNEAIEACRQALRIKPLYAQAHYALALNYLMLGDRAAALEQFGILKSLDQNLAIQLIHLINK